MRTVEYGDGAVRLIDQTLLPERLEYVVCRDVESVGRILQREPRGAQTLGAVDADRQRE